MFKKQPQSKAAANIKSSDRRKLLAQICATYNLPIEQISKEGLERLLPLVSKKASYVSIQGHLGVIYFDSSELPTWFQTRDSQVYPSLLTCWRCPFLLPKIATHPHVIEVLGKGADLMLPGTIPPFDKLAVKNAVVGIVSSDFPERIMAVGVCNLNLTQFDRVIGRSGTAVKILHHYNDELMRINKEIDVKVPDEVDPVMPTIDEHQLLLLLLLLLSPVEDKGNHVDKIVDDTEEKNNNGKEANGDKNDSITDDSEPKIIDSEEIAKQDQNQDQNQNQDEAQTHELDNGEKEQDQNHEKDNGNDDDGHENEDKKVLEVTETVQQLTVEEVDNFFKRSLIQTIKLESFDLPVTASTFMSLYIYKNLPVVDSSYVNIKKTSWKKTAKFLKAMSKLNYLEVKGKDEDLSIIKLMSKQHPTIENFVPHKINTQIKKTNNKESHSLMKVRTLYKPTKKLLVFFEKINKNYNEYYDVTEIRSFFETYIKSNNLVVAKNPKNITINELLSKLTNQAVNTSQPRDVLFKSVLTNFSPYFEIANGTEKNLGRGTPPKIQVVTELKIGRKVVTRVSNYDKFFIKQGAFAEELRNKCSGSSTIVDDQVQVQGPHGTLIVDLLKNKGIPVSCIEFTDKVKKNKKKK
ncbi:conserved hypothetical protein [Lodderomyces elongisporus NRRL YB-4239]|uniref:SUI1 domain-containing protein n=1 Tax=Lodderomyces elongisporus (strain ATCC 11503 / CBS 2605 / JCM 1781 / NBRC 1676 / NRRL YB-4239) TaxID=379508 RepID=A5E310_LODEL|nr:conserved hypothetical protein [Lodderomyces elongisporus NRRL YB-4239]